MKRLAVILVWSCAVLFAQPPGAKSVESIVAAYVKAVGGQTAVDGVTTREVRGSVGRGPKATYYWQKPNKVLLLSGKSKTGYDGSSGWDYSKKKKLKHLPLGAQLALEMNANPLRFVYLKSLYPGAVSVAPGETLDGKAMDVLVAPNKLGATKLYFDAQTHLLFKVEEAGEASAYFKNTTEFMDYKKVDDVLFPFRIVRSTTAPDTPKQDFHVSQVTNNVEIKPEAFGKPQAGPVTFGGKR